MALAEELNFNRAAERLHIAQPPLSRQIRELEEEIGIKLFHRTSRQFELTPAGKWLLPRAYEILDRVEQTRIGARLTSMGRKGELRIDFSGTVVDLIPTLKAYQSRFPHVGIILKHMNSNKIRTRPLIRIPFMAALPVDHPLTVKPSISVYDLKDETFIITPQSAGPIYYDMIMGLFRPRRTD